MEDPALSSFIKFWHRGTGSTRQERRSLPAKVVELVHQWKRLVKKEGVLYRQVEEANGV